MRLEDVLKSVVEEAVIEFRARIREIEEEALMRLREAGEELYRQAASTSQTINREAIAYRQRFVSQATLEARKEYLEAVDECVKTVMEEALKRISSLRAGEGYRRALKNLLLEAVEAVGSDEVVAECSGEDEHLVKTVALEVERERGVRISVIVSRQRMLGGVRVSSGDGSAIFDNTIEARLDRMRGELRNEIIRRLVTA